MRRIGLPLSVLMFMALSGCSTLSGLWGGSEPEQPADKAPAPQAKSPEPIKAEPEPKSEPQEEKVEVTPLPQAAGAQPTEIPATKRAPAETAEPALKLPEDPNTFLVTVAQKKPSHPDFGKGHAMGFLVNGEQ